jgi:hypothetical protein
MKSYILVRKKRICSKRTPEEEFNNSYRFTVRRKKNQKGMLNYPTATNYRI